MQGFRRGSNLGKSEPGLDERHPPGHRAGKEAGRLEQSPFHGICRHHGPSRRSRGHVELACPERRAHGCNFRMSTTDKAHTTCLPCQSENTKIRRDATRAELAGPTRSLLSVLASQELGATTITAGPVTASSALDTVASCFSARRSFPTCRRRSVLIICSPRREAPKPEPPEPPEPCLARGSAVLASKPGPLQPEVYKVR